MPKRIIVTFTKEYMLHESKSERPYHETEAYSPLSPEEAKELGLYLTADSVEVQEEEK